MGPGSWVAEGLATTWPGDVNDVPVRHIGVVSALRVKRFRLVVRLGNTHESTALSLEVVGDKSCRVK